MASVVLKSLSILLGLFFIFIGIVKLTPYISKELHRDLVSCQIEGHWIQWPKQPVVDFFCDGK